MLRQEFVAGFCLESGRKDNQFGTPQQVFFTSCRQSTGLGDLEQSIKELLDPAKQERWVRAAKAYTLEFLDEKKPCVSNG